MVCRESKSVVSSISSNVVQLDLNLKKIKFARLEVLPCETTIEEGNSLKNYYHNYDEGKLLIERRYTEVSELSSPSLPSSGTREFSRFLDLVVVFPLYFLRFFNPP